MQQSPLFQYSAEVFFDELDALGILHHSRYLHHLERSQQAFFQHLLGVADFNPERDEDIYVVVRDLSIRYRQPVRRPGRLGIDMALTELRAGGLTNRFVVRSEDRATVHCTGDRTVCKLSAETHRPTTWSVRFRKAAEKWTAGGSAGRAPCDD